MTTTTEAIHCDPDIMGGMPVFIGTRVPVRNLFDYLALSNLDEFLRQFPTVKREQAVSAIRQAEEVLIRDANSY